jgi:hypothetical protein
MGGMLDSWQQLERWASRHTSSIRGEAKLISARADSLQQAIRLSEGLTVYWILRDFRELDLQGVVNDIVEVLRQCLIVMLATTGGGALIGGISGGVGGAGVGAIPGVVVGAGAGAQVGEWILIAMGLKALAEYIVKDMPDIARDYWAGIRQAWLAATPPPLPQQPVRVDRLAVYHAAEKIARAHVAIFVLLLMGIVAYLAKGRGSMGELAESVRSSKVGPKFAEWMVRNEGKLKAEPRLRKEVVKPEEASTNNANVPKTRPQKTIESAKSEPAKAPLSVAQKRQLARDFYMKQRYPPWKIDSHLNGIDFNQPVEVVTLPKSTQVVQWQARGAAQGNYYAPPGTSPQQLGISPAALDPVSGQVVDRVAKTYITNSEVEVLKSTAAAVTDTWSIPGQTIATEGKAVQMLTAQRSAFDLIGGGQ